MELHKIIYEGNIRFARTSLTSNYLGILPVEDSELIDLVLSRLETLGAWITVEDYDAFQFLEILMDPFPLTDPLHDKFFSRLEDLRARFRSPFPERRFNLTSLKVTLDDPK
ncbi:MAG TPA: hypothetical protein PJ988_03145 [Anaerolinea sp.]|nr:hypothetical protein [Anaerolinea sp.]